MTQALARHPNPSLQAARPDLLSAAGLLDGLLLAAAFTAPLTRLYFDVAGHVPLTNLLGILFVIAFALHRVVTRNERLARESATALVFMAALAACYLVSFVGIDTQAGRTQFLKGLAAWGSTAAFLVCASAWILERGMALLRRTVLVLLAGFACSGVYAVAQLGLFLAGGVSLDHLVLRPLPIAASEGNGLVRTGGGRVWRASGLTLDPNHLGLMLAVPVALAAAWARSLARLAALLASVAGMAVSMSRSGIVAAAVAMVVLAVALRGAALRWVLLGAALVGSLGVAAAVAIQRIDPDLYRLLVLSRVDPTESAGLTHVRLYETVPDLLLQAPLFGNGLNSFALHFTDISGGREGFGPHSFWIQQLTETGLVGTALFLAFLGWLLRRLWRTGGPLALALLAAIVGTLVGNAFYLTTQMLYVHLLYALAIAAPACIAATRAGAAPAGGQGSINYNPRMTTEAPSRARVDAVETPPEASSPAPTDEVRLLGPLGDVIRYWWVVLLSVALLLALAALRSGGVEPSWRATATVYVGQAVSGTGQVLNTVSAKPATALEIANGDEAVTAAARASGLSPQRTRQALAVHVVQSPVGSKLANPPTLLRITATTPERDQAQRVANAVAETVVRSTESYADEKIRAFRAQVEAYDQALVELETQRRLAARSARSAGGDQAAVWAMLLTATTRDIQFTRADREEARAQLEVATEIEQSRIVSKPVATRTSSPARQPVFLAAGFVGLLVGAAAAVALGRMRRR